MIGETFGPYRVVDRLGEGGMGEVYRARDTTLGRDVALKILPPDVAHDADRVARFRREAQILAALNHPLIASIYGVDESRAPSLVSSWSRDRRSQSGSRQARFPWPRLCKSPTRSARRSRPHISKGSLIAT